MTKKRLSIYVLIVEVILLIALAAQVDISIHI